MARPQALSSELHPGEFDALTLLVTGGAGFLGQTVLKQLVNTFPGRIINVRRARRSQNHLPLPAPHVEVEADLHDSSRWQGLLREADYVFWMAALRDHSAGAAQSHHENVVPLRAAVSALSNSSRLKRFVFASSISALDQPPHPAPPRIIDDQALAYPCTPYGHSKLECETILVESGLPHTVLRFPFLYGPGFRRDSFLDFYRRVATNRALSLLRFTANLSLLYTGDVAGLLLEVLASRNVIHADASPYVVSDGHVYQVDELITLVARLHGQERTLVRIPIAVSEATAALARSSRALMRAGQVRRGHARLLALYWSHAAFTPNFFVVDSSRFRNAFPSCLFTPMEMGMSRTFLEEKRSTTSRESAQRHNAS